MESRISSNTFDKLTPQHKEHLYQARQQLNETFSNISLETLKKRFIIKYIKDEGFWLFDMELNKKAGYIELQGGIKNYAVCISKYGIEPEYQKYGLSNIILGLFITHMIPYVSKQRRQSLNGCYFGTELIKPHITENTYKYFEYKNGILKNPDMEYIRKQSLEKMQTPHMKFNSGTSHVHIGKYGSIFNDR